MIYAIIQARMGSTRLPNKVLMDLEGAPVLEHVINRLGHSNLIDEILVATSDEAANDAIGDLCSSNDIKCFKGSEDDVLDRFYQACSYLNVGNDDIIIRITADCPLIDYTIVDKVIKHHLDNNYDYTTNTMPCTYPDGLDCEVMNFQTLEEAWKNAKLASEREHVTLYIRNNSDDFKLGNVENEIDLSSLRWTLDEKEDYEFINEVYKNLFDYSSLFLTGDVLKLLDKKPELSQINITFKRNEGLEKSLKEDKVLE